MAIVVELGAGSANAESYCTVAFATAYHADRNNTAWAALATDALKEAALRKATEYMVGTYRSRWQGYRVNEDQSLDWPRYGVEVDGYAIDDDIVPEEIKKACAEFALRASSADLLTDQSQGVLSEKVGPIEVTYDKSSPQTTRYKAIENILLPFLKAGSDSICMRLVRS